MTQPGNPWILDLSPPGIPMQKSGSLFIGVSFRYPPLGVNGFGTNGREETMRNIKPTLMPLNLPIALPIQAMHIDSVRHINTHTTNANVELASIQHSHVCVWFILVFRWLVDATLYNPDQWADLFAQAGAQYVVLTSKHHEGYTLWDSREAVPATWNWNVMDVGPRRDLFGMLATAVRTVTSPHTAQTLKFGAYHSLFEWFHPAYLRDKSNNFSTSQFVDSKTLPELYDLVEKYQIEVVWSDGDWEAPADYWKSTEFLAWLATNSTVKDTVVWNDRWGKETRCQHGSFWNCNDRFQPNTIMDHYFEACMTLDKQSWGVNRKSTATDYLSVKELLLTLVQTISRNGNLLINVGPSADGTINPIMVDRLLDMGKWLSINGEAVYNTRSWANCTEPEGSSLYYTRSPDTSISTLYVFVTEWNPLITLRCISEAKIVRMLGIPSEGPHPVIMSDYDDDGAVTIRLPTLTPDIIPCQHVWVLAIEGYQQTNTSQSSSSKTPPTSRFRTVDESS
jgi:alpha-L-fucosidase